jgi:hypothetical protein
MFYTTKTSIEEIAKFMLNIELGCRYFVNGIAVEKPQVITHFTNADKSSTVVVKPIAGYIYGGNISHAELDTVIKRLISEHPNIKKMLDGYSSVSLTNVSGFTSLKIKFREPQYPGDLQNRCFTEFGLNTFSRFTWNFGSIENYFRSYASVSDVSVQNIIDFRYSILIDEDVIWENKDEYVVEPDDMKFTKNFKTINLNFIINLHDPFDIHSFIRNRTGHPMMSPYVPLYGDICGEINASEDTICAGCKCVLYDTYYNMVYDEYTLSYCIFCVHTATTSWSSGYTQYVLKYEKPDAINIVNSNTSTLDRIKDFNAIDRCFVTDWVMGEKQYMGSLFVVIGEKKWILNPSYTPISSIISNKKIMDTDKEIIIIL